ncbi:MAG: acyl-CoA dehydrogenase family protein [Alphaproteobacteria bacterium]
MAIEGLSFPPAALPPESEALRAEVRAFLREERASGGFEPICDSWMSGWSPEFSRKLGARGWLGMVWSKDYGGHERSPLDRFVVSEELLAAGAPVSAHWIADRQSGPLLLRFGTEEQRRDILPRIARGEAYFSIGLSEPDAGSDLAGIRTSMTRENGHWLLNGRKIWSSGAHLTDYMIALVRSAPPDPDNRHAGMSQILLDLRNTPGLTMQPIHALTGAHHFNEITFEDVEIADDQIIGEVGRGWAQVTDELGYERSGPERFLSTFPLVTALVDKLRQYNDPGKRAVAGRLIAQLWAMRQMSVRVVGMLAAGKMPNVEAAVVKDIGTRFERESVEIARSVFAERPALDSDDPFARRLAEAVLHSPAYTLRGGTNEILRGIIAKGMGLR